MPLPDLIEIVPLEGPVKAEITVPGSKSITNRALIFAALANGETTLEGALWSEDTQVMTDCLQTLGFEINVTPCPEEFCNRTITVKGLGGRIPNTGINGNPLDLFVGNAGTAARFLSALVCLGSGVFRLSGVPRMHERPQAALFKALRELGYKVESKNDRLPVVIFGSGPKTGKCTVSIEESSQFASALLLCAKVGGWKVEIVGENAEESLYVAMTTNLLKAFTVGQRQFRIEADASSASYFAAAGSLSYSRASGGAPPEFTIDAIIRNQPGNSLQIDANFTAMFAGLMRDSGRSTVSRRYDLGDSIMTAIVLAPFFPNPVKFTDLGRLRVQETERVKALHTELAKCGAKVVEEGEMLAVHPSQPHGAEIETYNDHRMAMCFAILGLKVPGIKIKNPSCVKKTFPNFFQKLAAAPPKGLGVTIFNARTGRRALTHDELFAD